MPELCLELGADKLRLQRFHASGKGLQNSSQYAITEDELARAVEETREASQDFGIEMLPPLAAPNCFGNFSIGPEGEVFFSYGDGRTKNKQKIGNLNDATLHDLWSPEMEESHRARIFAGERL